jgi:hypothetical protein
MQIRGNNEKRGAAARRESVIRNESSTLHMQLVHQNDSLLIRCDGVLLGQFSSSLSPYAAIFPTLNIQHISSYPSYILPN